MRYFVDEYDYDYDLKIIEKALKLYDEIYWEFTKTEPNPKRLGIRINPATGKKLFDKQVIADEIFHYLVNCKSLLEVDATRNFKYRGVYFVMFSLRKEIQIEARKKHESQQKNEPSKLFLHPPTRELELKKAINKYRFKRNVSRNAAE